MPAISGVNETYAPRGNISRIFTSKEPEVILAGPAGTGKTRGNLEYLNYWATEYSRCRILMARKTRRSLTESSMVTLEQKVLHPAQGVRWKASEQRYLYPNGSIIAVGGLDKPTKIMSSEWDIIYIPEATELTDDDWESCALRLRNKKLPIQQIIGDVNPGPATHWIKQRAGSLTKMWDTRHEDNPVLFQNGQMTPEGVRYLGRLDALTGVRYKRYRLGLWVSAEGMIYEDSWDRSVNLIDEAPIKKEWPRYLAIDFGFTHPFVCLWAAIDPDGRIYVYRHLYKTKTLVEDHAHTIAIVSGWYHLLPKGHPRYNSRPADWADPLPRDIICDHDAEDRATLERHLGLYTVAAKKTVSDGIQAVASRLRCAGDGKPRILVVRDSIPPGQRDHDLMERKQPTCLEDEPESYIWDTRQGMKKGEQPVKENDHALDALRYLVAYLDLQPGGVQYVRSFWR